MLTLITCLALCSCSCSNKAQKNQLTADFSRTAGVWLEHGSPNYARLIMDGAGAVESHYPENGGIEFTGYLGYDAEADTYAIFTDDDEFITDFTFDSDTVIRILGTDDLIYTKSDENLSVPVLISDNALAGEATVESNPDENGGYYYLSLSEDKSITTVNSCFASEMEPGEIIEAYIVKCISALSESDISDVKIEENTDYTAKIGHHVYLVSWTSRGMLWHSFFFMTNTHTYMHTMYAPVGEDIPYKNVFDGLHISE